MLAPNLPLITPDSEDFSEEKINGHNWRRYILPNGAPYWHSPQMQVVSDERPQEINLDKIPNISSSVLSGVSNEWEFLVAWPSIHVIHHKNQFMSEPSRSISFEAFRQQSKQAETNIGLKLELQTRYWAYVQAHPNHISLHPDALQAAKNAILWSYADRTLFEASNAPFDKATAQDMLSIMQHLQEGRGSTLSIWFIAAILRATSETRRATKYGTEDARRLRHLEKLDGILDRPVLPSLLVAIFWKVSVALTLGASVSYLKRIIDVDRPHSVTTSRWQAFVRHLCAEWVDIILLSTVLVSSTITLLSMETLNPLTRFVVFSSVLCSLSAICCGMLLIFTHRGRIDSGCRLASQYFERGKGLTRSVHGLAILLSLPSALCLWSIFWFLFSVVCLAFQLSGPQQGKWLQIATVLAVVALLIVVVLQAYIFYRPGRQLNSVQSSRRSASNKVCPQFIQPNLPRVEDYNPTKVVKEMYHQPVDDETKQQQSQVHGVV